MRRKVLDIKVVREKRDNFQETPTNSITLAKLVVRSQATHDCELRGASGMNIALSLIAASALVGAAGGYD